MRRTNYFFLIFLLLIFLINSCSFFKDEKKDNEKGTFFIETIAKPDPTLRGVKVSLPKPTINNTWNQVTNNEAHKVIHPYVGKKINGLFPPIMSPNPLIWIFFDHIFYYLI